MRKQGVYLILVVVVLAAVLVAVFWRERESSYGGKRLSEWVDLYSHPASQNRREAGDAIRHIGAKPIPFLLNWIRYEPPAWKTKSIAMMNRFLHSHRIDEKARRADGAMDVVINLAEKGEAAVPWLALMMNDFRAPTTAHRAQVILEDGTRLSEGPVASRWSSRALVTLLRDSDPDLSIAAAHALHRIDPKALKKATAGGVGKGETKSE